MPGVDWSPASEPVTVLRMHAGPRVDWVERTSLEAVGGTPFRIQADSDRVGLRLQGPVLVRSTTRELASEGVVLGAVQLPPSGQPVVFLADHPVTGGYPVIGVIDPADLDGCAQLRPGDEVWLQSVGPGFG
jgi:allophanate hydrolase subunit 2